MPASTDLELVAAWDEWQQYRQARHRAPMNGKRIDWTEQAARLTARQVDEFARSHGARIVADRIRSAIAGGWQGLNLDKLGDSRPQHKPPVSRNGSGFVMTEQQRIDLDADSLPDNI